jgi:hypothetical protein
MPLQLSFPARPYGDLSPCHNETAVCPRAFFLKAGNGASPHEKGPVLGVARC